MHDFEEISSASVGGTSILDSASHSDFVALCAAAARNDSIFREFRAYRSMYLALDHVSFEQGLMYIHELSALDTRPYESAKVLKLIDAIGSPRKYRFPTYGTVSPAILRYLKVYLEITHLFGSLSHLRVAEIGVGFGGQAALINLFEQTASYVMHDLPPVLELSSKFMNALKIPGSFEYIDGRNPNVLHSDMVISNYAFSELAPFIQERYLNQVILNSPRGYLTWNSLSRDQLGGYSLGSLLRMIPDSEILPERPLTHENNVIIVWGLKRKE